MTGAIDRLIDLLPLPALIAVAALSFSAWLIKEYKGLAHYGAVLRDRLYQAVIVLILVGTIAYYLVNRPQPFSASERGILVAAFEGDGTGGVRRHTAETLRSESHTNAELGGATVSEINVPVSDTSAPELLESRRALAVVGGSVVNDKVVWYRIYFEKHPAVELSENNFPDIDEFKARFLSLMKGPQASSNATANIASTPVYAAASKIAVVIGNSKYDYGGTLLGPKVDAALVSAAFKRLGIPVITINDGRRDQIFSAVREAITRVGESKDGIVYLYYSGHGSPNGEAVLYPVDVANGPIKISELTTMIDQSTASTAFIFLDSVMGTLSNITSRRVAILGAGQTGEMVMDTPEGGIFTETLTAELMRVSNTPGTKLSFSELADRVTRGVIAQTDNRNRPVALSFSPRIVAVYPTPKGSGRRAGDVMQDE